MRVATVVVVLWAVACGTSTFEAADNDGGSAADSGTGDATDASAEGSPSDGGDDANNVPGNLLTDPGFEDSAGGVQCGPAWTTGNAGTTLSISPIARSGSQSCMVCAMGGQLAILKNNPGVGSISNPIAGVYQGVAYAQAVNPDGGDVPMAQVQVSETLSDGGSGLGAGTNTMVGATWTQVSMGATLDPGSNLRFDVTVYPGSTALGCLLIDDVSLVVE
jgi:hypothetical protein